MPRSPTTISWEIGRDKYNRRVMLHWKGGAFNIESEPASQRDEGERIYSLTVDCILAAADILKDFKS